MMILINALVLSRLDYCNSILADLPDITMGPLCSKVDSNIEAAGSSIATHDGALLKIKVLRSQYTLLTIRKSSKFGFKN